MLGISDDEDATGPASPSRSSAGVSRAEAARVAAASAFPPLRVDAPGRLPYGRGSVPQLESRDDRQRAMDGLLRDVYAASSRSSATSRLGTLTRMLAQWDLVLVPLDVQKVLALGATLKAGRYRSAALYLSAARVENERQGAPTSAAVLRAIKDAVRSCERGLGPPTKASGLPFSRLGELPAGEAPWTRDGPIGPRNCMVVGSWWLTREVELSTARAALVQFTGTGKSMVATWCLPASKNDAAAMGATRCHGCCCGAGDFGTICPVHAMAAQRDLLRRSFPRSFDAMGVPESSLPLFPCSDGSVCKKAAMVATIGQAAGFLGLPARTPDGLNRWTGHSLRVTGAQGLAAAGLDTWAIQLMGRWGSDAVLGYIREAPLTRSALMAQRVASGMSVQEAIGAILAMPQQAAPSSRPPERANVRRWMASALAPLSARLQTVSLRQDADRARLACLEESLATEVQRSGHLSQRPEAAPSGMASEAAGPVAQDVQACERQLFVRNPVSGVIHALLGGDGTGAPHTWSIVCGWKPFPSAVLWPSLPQSHKTICGRCLPKERSAAKAKAAEVAAAV